MWMPLDEAAVIAATMTMILPQAGWRSKVHLVSERPGFEMPGLFMYTLLGDTTGAILR